MSDTLQLVVALAKRLQLDLPRVTDKLKHIGHLLTVSCEIELRRTITTRKVDCKDRLRPLLAAQLTLECNRIGPPQLSPLN